MREHKMDHRNNPAHIRTILFALLTLCITIAIFHNSLQDSKTSNTASESVAQVIKPILDPQEKLKESELNKLTRKLAHGVEFCVLGFSVGGLMLKKPDVKDSDREKSYGISHLSTALFYLLSTAVIDEYIQSFTGRTSSVKDILIDFSGAVVGILLFIAVMALYRLIHRNRAEETV